MFVANLSLMCKMDFKIFCIIFLFGLNIIALYMNCTANKTTQSEKGEDWVHRMNMHQLKSRESHGSSIPTVHMITPTYSRQEQRAELTRLAQTLAHVSSLHWIIVEDASNTSSWIDQLALDKHVNVTHLATNKRLGSGRGAQQRNVALDWIKRHDVPRTGVIYFGDDDNAYDTRLFDTIRSTATVSLVPVGNFPHVGVSTPVVVNNTVVDFVDSWLGGRKFPVDLACIVVSVGFWANKGYPLLHGNVGQIETSFMSDLNITMQDIEVKAEKGKQIYVWHTQTVEQKASKSAFEKNQAKYTGSNLDALQEQIIFVKS